MKKTNGKIEKTTVKAKPNLAKEMRQSFAKINKNLDKLEKLMPSCLEHLEAVILHSNQVLKTDPVLKKQFNIK